MESTSRREPNVNDTRARLGALRRQSGIAAGEAVTAGERETIDLSYSRAINVINSTLRYSGYRAG